MNKADLQLSVEKTTEMVVTFSQRQQVEVVDTYKYLGTVFDQNLKFDNNVEKIVKKCQQSQLCLEKLNSFEVSTNIMTDSLRAY